MFPFFSFLHVPAHGAFRARVCLCESWNAFHFSFLFLSVSNSKLRECTCFFHFASSNFAQVRQENRISAVVAQMLHECAVDRVMNANKFTSDRARANIRFQTIKSTANIFLLNIRFALLNVAMALVVPRLDITSSCVLVKLFSLSSASCSNACRAMTAQKLAITRAPQNRGTAIFNCYLKLDSPILYCNANL